MISDHTVKEFQGAMQSEYDITLNEEEARKTLTGLVDWFDLLAEVYHSDDVQVS